MSTIARPGVVEVEETDASHLRRGDMVVVLGPGTSMPQDIDAVLAAGGEWVHLDLTARAPGRGQLDLIDRLPPDMRGLAGEGSQQSSAVMSPLGVLQAARRRADGPKVSENPSAPCPASEIAEVRLITEDQVRRRDALDARIAADLDRPRRSWWQRLQRPRP